jgi:hypothetical protein
LEQTIAISEGLLLALKMERLKNSRAMIRAVIARHGIRGIAQEMSPEGVHALQKTGSVGFSLCRELGLAHLYCDPDAATREALFIPKGEEGNPKRERYWLEQLQAFAGFPALFILGANHFESFKNLLTQSGFQVIEIVRDWEPSGDWGQNNWKFFDSD